jgi:hypothetical protein
MIIATSRWAGNLTNLRDSLFRYKRGSLTMWKDFLMMMDGMPSKPAVNLFSNFWIMWVSSVSEQGCKNNYELTQLINELQVLVVWECLLQFFKLGACCDKKEVI